MNSESSPLDVDLAFRALTLSPGCIAAVRLSCDSSSSVSFYRHHPCCSLSRRGSHLRSAARYHPHQRVRSRGFAPPQRLLLRMNSWACCIPEPIRIRYVSPIASTHVAMACCASSSHRVHTLRRIPLVDSTVMHRCTGCSPRRFLTLRIAASCRADPQTPSSLLRSPYECLVTALSTLLLRANHGPFSTV
jgi:hypothetical protein